MREMLFRSYAVSANQLDFQQSPFIPEDQRTRVEICSAVDIFEDAR